MSIPNQIAIDSTSNTVTVQTDENLLLITNVSYNAQITPPTSNQIVVEADPVNINIQTSGKSIFTYNETPIVEVDVIQPITKVIQVATIGAQGPVGPVGPIGPPGVITAASGLIVTGSIFVSGSPGSVTATSFTGSLFGTASWAINALTASFLPVNTYQITSSWAISASQALTASYVDAQNVVGLNLSRISTGSITASVNVGNDTFRIQSGSSTYFFISSSGRIGIGTTTPINTLQVNGGITATSFTGSFSGSVRAPGASGDLLRNFNGVLSSANGTGVVSNANAIIITDVVSIPGTDAGGLRLIVGPGDGNRKHYAIIPEIYTSKGDAALGNSAFSTAQRQVGGKQIQDFILTTGITGGDPKTGTTASVMSLTEDQNVGIGTTTPTAKLQVVGSVLISGSNTLTNIGPAVFSGSIDVTQGDVTLQESLCIIKKVSIGTTHQSASLTISGSSSNDTLLVKLNDSNGDTDKFKINNEGIVVLGTLSSSPTPVAGGIYFSAENDYFFGFS
jgi:hypothetical protein